MLRSLPFHFSANWQPLIWRNGDSTSTSPKIAKTAEGSNDDNERVDENDLEDWGYVNEERNVVEGEATDDDDCENERAPDEEYGDEGYAPFVITYRFYPWLKMSNERYLLIFIALSLCRRFDALEK